MTPSPASPGAQLSAPAPLSAEHDVAPFDCGEPALDTWLKRRALRNESRFSRTFVVCDGQRVVAFYALSAGSVERAAALSKLRRNAPDTIPVTVLGRLAVDRAYAGRGLGADILSDAFRRIAVASQSVGIGAVLIQAKDENAERFYRACAEFSEYPVGSRMLFLPIETLIAAFS